MRRPLLVLVLLAATLLPAASAAAQGDRAAARAYGEAANRAYRALQAQKGAVEQRYRTLLPPECADVFANVPRRAQQPAVLIVTAVILDALITPTRPALTAFVEELEAVRTRDARLRSGRAGWRTTLRQLGRLPALPADLCAQLRAWRDAGYTEAALPQVDLEALVRESSDADDRKISRAAARLRALGVSRRTARRFTGEALLGSLIPQDALEETAGTPA